MNNADYDAMVKRMTGYSKAELDAAWELVKPAKHWKDPIDAVIPVGMRAVVLETILFFTATPAIFRPAEDGFLHVRAIGYRAGPAGDH